MLAWMRACMLHDASAVDDDYDDVAIAGRMNLFRRSHIVSHTTMECVLAGLCASEGDDDYDEDDAIADRMNLSRISPWCISCPTCLRHPAEAGPHHGGLRSARPTGD